MGIGKDYAKRTSKFVQIGDGESYEGVFEGMKSVVKDSFGEEKEVMRYKLDGKTFDSMSGSLARQMDNLLPGNRVKISRTGDGAATKWKVENLDNPQPAPEAWEEGEPE